MVTMNQKIVDGQPGQNNTLTSVHEKTALNLSPRNFQEAEHFAEIISKTAFVPKDYYGKPQEILVAMSMGAEVGLSPIQSIQNIAVISGRPSIWGDAMLALVQASGLLKFHKEYFDKDETAVCEVARKGDVDEEGKQVIHVVRFSNSDRDKAGLTNKGVHGSYPKRMKQMRARGFALRDKFADVLKGLIAREEAIDITPMAEIHSEQPGELTDDEIPRAKVIAVPDAEFKEVDEAVQDEGGASQPEASGSDQGEQPAVSPTGGDGLSDEEKALARDMLAKAPGNLLMKMAKVRKMVPGFTSMDNLKASELELFAKALQ